MLPVSDLALRVGLTRDFLRLLIDAGACPPYVWNSVSIDAQENGSKKMDASAATPTINAQAKDTDERSSVIKSDQLELPQDSAKSSDVNSTEDK